jgi:hypothetical protein
MDSAESASKIEAQNEIVPEEGSMVYMTEHELTKFLDDRKDLDLSQEEQEYLFLRRRRLSLEMVCTLLSQLVSRTSHLFTRILCLCMLSYLIGSIAETRNTGRYGEVTGCVECFESHGSWGW